jgi:hypothetical protein
MAVTYAKEKVNDFSGRETLHNSSKTAAIPVSLFARFREFFSLHYTVTDPERG